MHRTIAVLLEAFNLSSAPNDEIEKATKDLLVQLGEDLDVSKSDPNSKDGPVGYVESGSIHKATTFLASKIEEFNREQEEDANNALIVTDEDLAEASQVEEDEDEPEEDEDVLDGEDADEPTIKWDK